MSVRDTRHLRDDEEENDPDLEDLYHFTVSLLDLFWIIATCTTPKDWMDFAPVALVQDIVGIHRLE